MTSHMIQNLMHPHMGEKIHDTMHLLQDVLHPHTGKHPKEITHEKAPKEEHVGPDEDSCPLDELKKCKERFDDWKSEVENAGHDSDQPEYKDILVAILEVGERTDTVLKQSETAIEKHRTFCQKLATRLRVDMGVPLSENPGDDVVCAGEEVRKSFVALFPRIDDLEVASQNFCTKLTCFLTKNGKDGWHEQLFRALKIVLAIIVKTALVVIKIHPAGHIVHELVKAIAPQFDVWVEKELKKARDVIPNLIAKVVSHHPHIVHLLQKDLPKQIEGVQRKLREFRNGLEQEARQVDEQLKTSREHIVLMKRDRVLDAANRMGHMSNGAHVKTLGKVHLEMHHLWHLYFYSKVTEEGPQLVVHAEKCLVATH